MLEIGRQDECGKLNPLATDSMSTERKITVSYVLNVPQGVKPPLSNSVHVPPSSSITFPIKAGEPINYKILIEAVKEAKTKLGDEVFTPWRDAVGDAEKEKDLKKPKTADSDSDSEVENDA